MDRGLQPDAQLRGASPSWIPDLLSALAPFAALRFLSPAWDAAVTGQKPFRFYRTCLQNIKAPFCRKSGQKDSIFSLNTLCFNAAITACEKGQQWMQAGTLALPALTPRPNFLLSATGLGSPGCPDSCQSSSGHCLLQCHAQRTIV